MRINGLFVGNFFAALWLIWPLLIPIECGASEANDDDLSPVESEAIQGVDSPIVRTIQIPEFQNGAFIGYKEVPIDPERMPASNESKTEF